MTVHFSCVVLRLRWIVELFRVVATTEKILLAFCRLGNSRISSFLKKKFSIHLLWVKGKRKCKLCLVLLIFEHSSFTKEIGKNGKILFLDCLVTGDNDRLRTTIYRKPTHTDRLLDQSSYNPTSHKTTTIRTLTRRVQLVCDSPDSLQDETDYLNNVFSKNNYNTDFVRRNTHSNTDSNTQTNSGLVTTATIPYIRGTSETIARTLQP